MSTPNALAVTTEWERYVADYWDSKREDFNLLLARTDGLVHHHFGLGDYDPSVIGHQERIEEELHRLESIQVTELIKLMEPLGSNDRVLDGGSGRGGTSFMIHSAFSCLVDGVTLSPYQCEFSRKAALARGISNKVHFHEMNMLHMAFEPGYFDCIVTNETTMYVQALGKLFAEFARVLRPGGHYVLATFCIDDDSKRDKNIEIIDDYYHCVMHTRAKYLEALVDNGFIPGVLQDRTLEAIPYFQLRLASSQKGVSDHYIETYTSGVTRYLLIECEYSPDR